MRYFGSLLLLIIARTSARYCLHFDSRIGVILSGADFQAERRISGVRNSLGIRWLLAEGGEFFAGFLGGDEVCVGILPDVEELLVRLKRSGFIEWSLSPGCSQ